jgi:tetratricopeptide (TPR) repeat protein
VTKGFLAIILAESFLCTVLAVQGQSVPNPPAPAKTSSSAQPEFFDEPHFTVAGVTDTTNLGGHGSDAVVRNREALAEEAAALNKPSSASVADAADYQRMRAKLQSQLAEENKSAQEKAEIYRQLGDLDEKLGDPLDAVQNYRFAAQMDPSEANLFDWGTDLLLHNAAQPAVEVFAKGNRLFPRSVRMLTALGAAWYAAGSYAQAAKYLCAASDLDPDDPNPYLFMGRIQSVETAESQAVADRLARFARLQPENALANYYYAVSLWQQRGSSAGEDFLQVKSLLEKATRLDPMLAPAYLQLGIVYAEQKDWPRAISAYTKAIEAAPRMEQARYRLAQAYRLTGESKKSQEELQIYEGISKEKADEAQRKRHEVKQFVYRLQEPPAAKK